MFVLACFREFSSTLLLINPDVFAGVLSDLEVLLSCSSHSLVDLIVTWTGICIVFSSECFADGESLSFVGFKGIFVGILSDLGILSRNLKLVLPDVLTSILGDLKLSFFGLCSC